MLAVFTYGCASPLKLGSARYGRWAFPEPGVSPTKPAMKLLAIDLMPQARSANCKLRLVAPEEGEWFVETNIWLKFVFSGAIKARINEDVVPNGESSFVCEVADSDWVKSLRSDHEEKNGSKLSAVLDDVRHYIVCGEDMTISILARSLRSIET